MKPRWLSALGRVRRRCQRWFGGDFDYRVAYRKADLDRVPWEIVGPSSEEEFRALGRVKRQLLIDNGLTPESRVLDVGCGTGLLTSALEDYLSPRGLYCGTDIAPEAIALCRERFRRPNFSFVVNELTRLPIEGDRFDLIFFGSVFTHIYPAEIRDLLADMKRLLAPTGLIVADAFVDPAVRGYRGDRSMVVVNESYLLETFDATGLHHETLGTWPCRPEINETYRGWPCGPGTRRSIFRIAHVAVPVRASA